MISFSPTQKDHKRDKQMNSPETIPYPEGPAALIEETMPCPLCHGLDQRIITRRREKSLRKCRSCRVTFLSPRPRSETLASYFDHEVARPFDSDSNRGRVLEKIAARIQRRKLTGTIVDVGCATGLFLGRFFSETQWRRHGVELSHSSAEAAELRGIKVSRGNIQGAGFATASVDVITVLDAFYYFPEPQCELTEFRRILKNDGILVLELPAATSRILRLSGLAGRWLSGIQRSLFDESDHLFYHTPESISRLLEANGFRIKEIVILPANRQDHWLRELLYRTYVLFSRALRLVTKSRIFLCPRFLVIAEKYHPSHVASITDHK